MAKRIPNPAAIAAVRRRPSEALVFPGDLLHKLRKARSLLEELEVLATDAPADRAPPAPEKAAGTLRGARRSLEKWGRAIEQKRKPDRTQTRRGSGQ